MWYNMEVIFDVKNVTFGAHVGPIWFPPFGPKPEQDRTESEEHVRLRTCTREAVQAVCEVLRLVLKETSCGRQQEAAASHSSKRAKQCKRAGGR